MSRPLPPQTIAQIGALAATGLTARQIGLMLLPIMTRDAVLGVIYRHKIKLARSVGGGRTSAGWKHTAETRAKLCESQRRRRITEAWLNGWSALDIARRAGIGTGDVKRIVREEQARRKVVP